MTNRPVAMAKAHFIINPTSGRGKPAKCWPRIQEIFRAENWEFDATFTQRPGEASEIARQAAKNGFELIVPVGGDGTIHEVVNGLFADGKAINPQATLGLIPSGTGNDLARVLGLPRETLAAARHLATSKRSRAIDLGEATVTAKGKSVRHLFTNDADLGFAAKVVERLERGGKFSRGTAPYFIALLRTALEHRNQAMQLKTADHVMNEPLTTVLVCNGQSTGAGMKVAPDAILDDGLFDVVVVRALSRLEIFRHAPKIYNGTHVKLPQVSVLRAQSVTLTSPERVPIVTDGELVGETPASFRVLPGALRVHV